MENENNRWKTQNSRWKLKMNGGKLQKVEEHMEITKDMVQHGEEHSRTTTNVF